jgi:hypothetical protein
MSGGDTRDGREASVWPILELPPQPPARIWDVAARPAAAPADDTGELREAIIGAILFAPRDDEWPIYRPTAARIAAAVLALPAVRDLADGRRTDRAKIAAVEALHHPVDGPYGKACATCIGSDEELLTWPCDTGRALGGER